MALEKTEDSVAGSACCGESKKGFRLVLCRSCIDAPSNHSTTAESPTTSRQTVHSSLHIKRSLRHCPSPVHSLRWRRSRSNAFSNHAQCSSNHSPLLSPNSSKDWNQNSHNVSSFISLYSVISAYCCNSTVGAVALVRDVWGYVVPDVSGIVGVGH